MADQKSSTQELLGILDSIANDTVATETTEQSNYYQQLERIMYMAAQKDASDIFIAPSFPPAIKVNGVITPLSKKPLSTEQARQIVYSTLREQQERQFEEALELSYAINLNEDVRFRVNAYHEQGRVGMVMRKINTEITTLEELQMPDVLKRLAVLKRGLVIVVGATGSGKSTTLAAMVDRRNKLLPGHIITIEDPIEFVHRHQKSIITQREIGLDTDNWHTALKNALRQAPDVVVIGEIRDEESMSHALQLAQTGHLCLCTLHATNANQALERVVNFYSEERHAQIYMDLALNLAAIVSQRLVLKKDGSGRLAALDIMLNTPAIQDHIFKGKIAEIKEVMDRSQDDGMQTFDGHLVRLFQAGIIEYDEALRNADSSNDVRLAIKLWQDGAVQEETTFIDRLDNLNLL